MDRVILEVVEIKDKVNGLRLNPGVGSLFTQSTQPTPDELPVYCSSPSYIPVYHTSIEGWPLVVLCPCHWRNLCRKFPQRQSPNMAGGPHRMSNNLKWLSQLVCNLHG